MNLMRRTDVRFWPLLILLLGVAAAGAFAWGVLEGLPHLEDEMAYLFQARVFAAGRLTAPATEHRCAFWEPFIVEVAGRRFGKYPPGWPALLALGVLAGAPWLVNPLLGGLSLCLLYRIGRILYRERVGLLAAALGATSPLYLTLCGSLMAHSAAAFFFLLFFLAFLRFHCTGRSRWAVVAGLAMGAVFVTRPLTAVGLGLGFAIYGLAQILRQRRPALRRWLPLAAGALAVAALLPLFNWAVAGSPLANPYRMIWPDDRIGFGAWSEGHAHTVADALGNLAIVLLALSRDLLGWPGLSWVGVVVALALPPRSRRDWVLTAPLAGLSLAYTLYWFSGVIPYGPRYHFEGATLLWLLTAVGVEKLARRLPGKGQRTAAAVLALLLLSNLLVVLPARIDGLHALYGVTQAWFEPLDEVNLHHALVLCVGESWQDCRSMYGRMDPLARGDVIYAVSCSPAEDAALIADMPERSAYRFDGKTLKPVRVRHP